MGFLRGIEFSWTAQHLWLQTAIVTVLVLAIFFALDVWMARAEPPARVNETPAPIRLQGGANIALIAVIIAAILLSATWKPGIEFDLYGTKVELQNALRDAALIVVALASLWLTTDAHRAANGFTLSLIHI